jgi:hypothetical protein
VTPRTGQDRHCQYNYPTLAALIYRDPERNHAGISATTLANECVRAACWERTHDYARFPRQMQAAQRGTAQHDYLERFNEPEVLAEKGLVKVLPSGRTITGQIDRYRPDLARIEDYKCKADGHIFAVPPKKYAVQLNLYRYMIVTGCVIQKTGECLKGAVEQLVLYPSDYYDTKEVPVTIWDVARVEWYAEHMLDELERGQDPDYLPPRSWDPEKQYFSQNWCPHFTARRRSGGVIYHPLDALETGRSLDAP